MRLKVPVLTRFNLTPVHPGSSPVQPRGTFASVPSPAPLFTPNKCAANRTPTLATRCNACVATVPTTVATRRTTGKLAAAAASAESEPEHATRRATHVTHAPVQHAAREVAINELIDGCACLRAEVEAERQHARRPPLHQAVRIAQRARAAHKWSDWCCCCDVRWHVCAH
jgi:hypothetical protein